MSALHAIQDDFALNAYPDFKRDISPTTMIFVYDLVDASGNNLIDVDGNQLVTVESQSLYLQSLHTIQDDFALNAE
jgi:hypothetical protein